MVMETRPGRGLDMICKTFPHRGLDMVMETLPHQGLDIFVETRSGRSRDMIGETCPHRGLDTVMEPCPGRGLAILVETRPDRGLDLVAATRTDRCQTCPGPGQDTTRKTRPDRGLEMVMVTRPGRDLDIFGETRSGCGRDMTVENRSVRGLDMAIETRPGRGLNILVENRPDRGLETVEETRSGWGLDMVGKLRPEQSLAMVEENRPGRGQVMVERSHLDWDRPLVEETHLGRGLDTDEETVWETRPLVEETHPCRSLGLDRDRTAALPGSCETHIRQAAWTSLRVKPPPNSRKRRGCCRSDTQDPRRLKRHKPDVNLKPIEPSPRTDYSDFKSSIGSESDLFHIDWASLGLPEDWDLDLRGGGSSPPSAPPPKSLSIPESLRGLDGYLTSAPLPYVFSFEQYTFPLLLNPAGDGECSYSCLSRALNLPVAAIKTRLRNWTREHPQLFAELAAFYSFDDRYDSPKAALNLLMDRGAWQGSNLWGIVSICFSVDIFVLGLREATSSYYHAPTPRKTIILLFHNQAHCWGNAEHFALLDSSSLASPDHGRAMISRIQSLPEFWERFEIQPRRTRRLRKTGHRCRSENPQPHGEPPMTKAQDFLQIDQSKRGRIARLAAKARATSTPAPRRAPRCR